MAPRRTKKNKDNRTPADRKAAFIAALPAAFTVMHAAAAAGVGRRSVYEWRSLDPEFAKAWDEAVDDGAELIESALRKRAVDGVEETIFFQGRKVGKRRVYSDTAAIFLLKGVRPEKYRDQVAHTGAAGGPIAVAAAHVHAQVTDDAERAAATAEILARVGITGGAGARAPVDPTNEQVHPDSAAPAAGGLPLPASS